MGLKKDKPWEAGSTLSLTLVTRGPEEARVGGGEIRALGVLVPESCSES